jgi:hypothetical protein
VQIAVPSEMVMQSMMAYTQFLLKDSGVNIDVPVQSTLGAVRKQIEGPLFSAPLELLMSASRNFDAKRTQ